MPTNTYIPPSPWSDPSPQTVKQPAAIFNDSGSFIHRDEYGIITECTWEKLGDQLNVITITKQPRIWGEASQRRVTDGRQLVRGIISTHQQILAPTDFGYTIVGEFFEQITDYFVEFDPCVSYKTQFAVYNNNYATDRLDITVDGIDVWTDENGINAWETAEGTYAPTWVDVWSKPQEGDTPENALFDSFGDAIVDENGDELVFEE